MPPRRLRWLSAAGSFAGLLAVQSAVSALPAPVVPTPQQIPALGAANPWSPGAQTCDATTTLTEARALDPTTFVLRQNPCVDSEAPFMYLLLGQRRAVLIDSGAVDADEQLVVLVEQLRATAEGPLPLLVVHTHGHLDHRRGDARLAALDDVRVIGHRQPDLVDFWGLDGWPEGQAQIELGGRVLEVMPAPGHHPAAVAYFDRQTGSLITGDSLLPGRIYVSDRTEFVASARRLEAFAATRPVERVLGGHVELSVTNALYGARSTFRPGEHALELPAASVGELARAAERVGVLAPWVSAPTFTVVYLRGLLWIAGGALSAVGVFRWRLKRRRRKPLG